MNAFWLAAVAALGLSGAANATVTTFNVNGTFTNGAIVNGSFVVDDSQSNIFLEFTKPSFVVSNYPANTIVQYQIIDGIFSAGYDYVFDGGTFPSNTGTSRFFISFSSGRDFFEVYFIAYHDYTQLAGFQGANIVSGDASTKQYPFPPAFVLAGGTITPAMVPAVAEPASLALAGPCLFGAAMILRSRRRTARNASQ